ncbi:MAG: insulinase family protein [Bryobacteraceae bacterium]|nr:insulinase family protein [Bryobacteraceae bacterium]MDW8377121.1 pitrilysin family protein [Bryobacterales bacterium]
MRWLSFWPLLTMMLMTTNAAEKGIFPYRYDQWDLPNGLRLITVPTDYPNVVNLQIVVQVGSRNEVEPGKSGFAHFFEHMMFRGTKNTTPEEYERQMKQIGASFNASTWDDRTNYHTTFSKEDLETVLRLEADRFQFLSYSEAAFRTEALAVLGEYNKGSSEPFQKLMEVLMDTAFDQHTYKHTTIGFLKDIQDMPNQYEYSKVFFDRYYRPEYTTLIVTGDVDPKTTRALVEKYWGAWQRGSYRAEIPREPQHDGPRRNHVDWPTATLPLLAVAFHSAAYTDTDLDSAALDVIGYLGFSPNSELYRKLVIEDQVVDYLSVDTFDHVDPHLFTVTARIKKKEDLARVEKEILATVESFKEKLAPRDKLDSVKKHLRYRFALRLNNSEDIGEVLCHYVALRRTPETINRIYERYAALTAEDLQRMARKYFVDRERVIVTLTGK